MTRYERLAASIVIAAAGLATCARDAQPQTPPDSTHHHHVWYVVREVLPIAISTAALVAVLEERTTTTITCGHITVLEPNAGVAEATQTCTSTVETHR